MLSSWIKRETEYTIALADVDYQRGLIAAHWKHYRQEQNPYPVGGQCSVSLPEADLGTRGDRGCGWRFGELMMLWNLYGPNRQKNKDYSLARDTSRRAYVFTDGLAGPH